MNRIRYISLIMLLLTTIRLAGQEVAVIDSVCSGSSYHYRVDGEVGSTYLWELTLPDGTINTLTSTADTILIHWDYPAGVYRLTVMQFNEDYDCDAVPMDGDVIIYDLPPPPLAENMDACYDGLEHTATATSEPGTSIIWYTSETGYDPGEQPRGTEPGTYTAWAAAVNDITGCESSERTEVRLEIFELPEAPLAENNTVCFDGEEHSASAVTAAGNSIVWYANETGDEPGGQPIATDPGVYTAWAASMNDDTGCESSERIEVKLEIFELPEPPLAMNFETCFDGEEHTATATSTLGTSIVWYTSETGDEPGEQPGGTEPGTYTAWAAAMDTITGCESSERTEVRLEIFDTPEAPLADNNTVCFDGEEHSANAIAAAGTTIIWYASETGDEPGTQPIATNPGIYTAWAATISEDTSCESAERTEVRLEIFELPEPPLAMNFETCFDGEEHMATATSTMGTSIVWYTNETGDEPGEQPRGTEPGTYSAWAAAMDTISGCESATRVLVTLEIYELPLVSCPDPTQLTSFADPLPLSGGLPEGGVYEGPGVTDNVFYASVAGPGTHEISYTYTDANGCFSSCVFQIIVIDAIVDLNVSKTATAINGDAGITQYSAAGDVISYTITLANNGNVPISNIDITDDLTGDSWFIAELLPGEEQIFTTTWVITQEDLDRGSVTNIARAEGKDPNDDIVLAEDDETVYALMQPGLLVTKSATPQTYSALGEEISYTIIVENTGNVTITDVNVVDDLTGDSWFIAELQPGNSQSFTTTYLITQEDLDNGNVTNIARAEGKDPDDNLISDEDSETITAEQSPALLVSKTATPQTYNQAGDVITYSIIVTNTGNVTLTDISVVDDLTGDSWLIASLEPGEADSFSTSYVITITDMDAGRVLNTVRATGKDPDDQDVMAEDDEEVTAVQEPALALSKSASPASYSSVGEEITYTLTVTNNGNVTISNISLTDPLTGFLATIASLSPEEAQSFTTSYFITQDDLDNGSVMNTARAEGLDPDDQMVWDEDSEIITADTEPSLLVSKSAVPQTYDSAGDVITYTITVENTGNVTISDILVTDPLTGLSTTIASLDPGVTESYTETYIITQADLDAGSVINTAIAEGKDPDDGVVRDEDSETITANQQPELLVTKTAAPQTYNSVGDIITYTITVANTGNVTITDVQVTDPLTGLNASIASLDPGITDTFTETYIITQDDLDNGSVTNIARAEGKDPNGDDVWDEDSETVTANMQPALLVSKTAVPQTYASVGDLITYTISVENTGNVTITDVEVTDPLTGLTETISSLEPDDRVEYTETYLITQADLDNGSVVNTARAEGKDPNDEDVWDEDSETINANQQPELLVSKTAVPQTYNNVGDIITYTITVENTGNVTLTGVQVTDPLTGLNAAVANLTPGAIETFTETYIITQADLNNGTVVNTARAEGKDPNGDDVWDEDSETITANLEPELLVSKSAVPQTYSSVGEVITYTILVENTGNVTISNIQVSDPLTGLDTNIASLEPGITETYTETYVITQDDINNGNVVNTARAEGTDPAGTNVWDEDSETITADLQPELLVSKSAVPQTYSNVGEVITYTISVQNSGNVSISDIQVTDPLTGLDTSIASLEPGVTETYTETYVITQADLDSGNVVNTARAEGTDPAGTTVWDEDSETITAVQQPELLVSKTAVPQTYTSEGQLIAYTIRVENTGNVTITDIEVTDPLTGFTASIPSLAPGDHQEFNTSYAITQGDLDNGSVINTARAEGKDPANEDVWDEDSETITAEISPELLVSKSAVPQTYTSVGQLIAYTIRVENTGNVTISDIVVTDPLTGFTASIPSLAPDDFQEFSTSYATTQSDLDNGSLTNTARAEGKDPNGNDVWDEDSETINANLQPALLVSKTAVPMSYSDIGDVITYTIVVENTGNLTITDISVTDPLTGLIATIASMEPGASQTYNETYTITQADLDNGSLTNTARAEGKDPSDNQVWDEDSVTVNADVQPELLVQKTANPQTYNSAGQVITYTILVENTGNVTVSDVMLTDPLTGLNTSIGNMAPGAALSYTENYTITQADMDNGSVLNTARAEGSGPNDIPVWDEDSETVTALTRPELAVVKTATPQTYAAVGQDITYTIRVENTGNVTITDIEVTDPLTGFTSSIASLAPGSNQVFTTTYQITQDDLDNGSLTNTARAEGKDPNGEDVWDEDSETITADLQPGIAITKSASPLTYAAVGTVINYTITVENTGNVSLTDITVDDPLVASGPTYVSGDLNDDGILQPDETWTYTASYVITLADLNNGSFTNIASVTGLDPDGTEISDSDDARVTAVLNPQISLTKTANRPTFTAPGQAVVYTITVRNTGNVTLNDIMVNDPLAGFVAGPISLNPGQQRVFTANYTTTTQDVNNEEIVNIASTSGTSPQGTTVNASASVRITLQYVPSLRVTASVTPNTYNAPGQPLRFDFTLENNGNVALTNVIVTDQLTGLNQTIARLNPGETRLYPNRIYNTTQADIDNGSVSNTITARTTFQGNQILRTATAIATADLEPGLQISLYSANPTTYSTSGTAITFTIHVINTGNVSLRNVLVRDDLSNFSFTIPVLAPNETRQFNPVYTTTQDDLADGFINNEATVEVVAPNAAFLTDSRQLTLYALFNEIVANDVDATGNGVNGYIGGVAVPNVTYNDSLSGEPVRLQDVIISLVSPAANPGVTLNTTTGAVIVAPNTYGGYYNLTYQICERLNTLNCDQAVVYITVEPIADLHITKVADRDSVTAGNNIFYTITVYNDGPNQATGVRIIDNPGPSFTQVDFSTNGGASWQPWTGSYLYGDMEEGESVQILLRARVHTAQVNPVVNTARVNSDTFDPDLDNNIAVATTPVRTIADLSVTKSAPATVYAGDLITYVIRVRNLGPSLSRNIRVTDILPSELDLISAVPSTGTWTDPVWNVGIPPINSEVSLTITARVRSDVPEGTILVNTATVSSETYDPNPNNNSYTARTTVLTAADLAVTKTADDLAPNVNDLVTFTIGVTNLGPSLATGIEIIDLLPAGFEFVSAVPDADYNPITGIWTAGRLDRDESASLDITARVLTPQGSGNDYLNVAEVHHSDQFDPVSSNNRAELLVEPQIADLAITKTVDEYRPNVGDLVQFTIELRNLGPSTATNVVVSDILPSGLEFVSANPAAAYDEATGLWTIGSLAYPANTSLQITALVLAPDDNEPDQYLNIAEISHSDQFDPDTLNNRA
jgi:uncharacterized repeat protein (TIGR01451 family)